MLKANLKGVGWLRNAWKWLEKKGGNKGSSEGGREGGNKGSSEGGREGTRDRVRDRLSHKLLSYFSASFEIFGNFCDFRQLLKFLATFDFFFDFFFCHF